MLNIFKDAGVVPNSGTALKQFRFTADPIKPQYLILVEIKLKNSSGYSSAKWGKISLTDIQGKSSVTLEIDNFMPRGSVCWQGCLPVSSGQMVEANLYSCEGTDLYEVVYICSDNIIPNGGFNFGNAIATYPLGLPDYATVNGTAATEITLLRPAHYYAYELIKLYGYHDDDGGNRACSFNLTDGTNTLVLSENAALAANTKLQGIDANVSKPLIITYDKYLSFVVTAIAAGKKGYIRSYIRVFGWETT